jgi:3-dehydroquinate dehydratase I
MGTAFIGGLSIGRIPRVVGTISQWEALQHFHNHSAKSCDIVEARLDEIGVENPWQAACKAIDDSGVPVLATLRSTSEGGKCDRNEDDRLKILESALPYVSMVDVEFNSNAAQKLAAVAKEHGKHVLVSFHDFKQTPSLDQLSQIVESASASAAVIKISTMVRSDGDIATLQSLLARRGETPLCVIGMGAAGTKTRTVFPCIGSCFTYGYLDTPSAPGQLPAVSLVDHLRAVIGAYNEEFVTRHEILEFV